MTARLILGIESSCDDTAVAGEVRLRPGVHRIERGRGRIGQGQLRGVGGLARPPQDGRWPIREVYGQCATILWQGVHSELARLIRSIFLIETVNDSVR